MEKAALRPLFLCLPIMNSNIVIFFAMLNHRAFMLGG